MRLDNGSLTSIAWGGAGPQLLSYNVVPTITSAPVTTS
jgi:hypothetical protein